jgi:hypothetical protein
VNRVKKSERSGSAPQRREKIKNGRFKKNRDFTKPLKNSLFSFEDIHEK